MSADQATPLHAGEAEAAPIVILGGAGFIGSNLAKSFLVDGEPVHILDNLSRGGVEENLNWLKAAHGSLVRFSKVDVRDLQSLTGPLGEARAVYHLAAQTAVTTSLDDPMDDFSVNAQGTINVLEAVRRSGRKIPVIFSSTNKVYGGLDDLEMVEGDTAYTPADTEIAAHGVSEKRPLDFCTPYGCSKGVADQYVHDYAKSFDLPTAVLRMSCIYGPRQFGTEDQGWVAHFLIKALGGEAITIYGNGKQVRDILFVDDAVAAYRALLANIDRMKGRVFNLGGGPENAVSLKQVLGEITHLTNQPLNLSFGDWRQGDQFYFVADTRLLETELGWRARVGWEEGMHRLAHWLAESRGFQLMSEPERASAVTEQSAAADETPLPRRILMTLDAVGGVWRYALDLAEALRARDIETVFAGFGPAASAEQVAEANAIGRLVETGAPLDWTAAEESELAGTAALIARLTDAHAVDLVHLNLPSQAAGLQLAVPVVAVSHSCVVTWFKAVRGAPVPADWAWQEKLNRTGFAAADVLLAPSQSHADLLQTAYGDIGPVAIVPNAARPGVVHAKEPFVLAAGRWWDEGKNGALLDRAATLTKWPTRMAGSQLGPNGQWQALEHAEVLGSLPGAALRDLMARAAIVVSPSIYEPFGLVALEAGMAGAALVLADIPTYREIWDGAALFAPTDDAGVLAETLNGLAADPERRATLGAAARARAEQFTLARQADAMVAAYRLAGERHAARHSSTLRRAS